MVFRELFGEPSDLSEYLWRLIIELRNDVGWNFVRWVWW
jgi:hypothetical protein